MSDKTEKPELHLFDGTIPIPESWRHPHDPTILLDCDYRLNGKNIIKDYLGIFVFDKRVGDYVISSIAHKYLAEIARIGDPEHFPPDDKKSKMTNTPKDEVLFFGDITIYKDKKIFEGEYNIYKGQIFIAKEDSSDLPLDGNNGLINIVFRGNGSVERVESIIQSLEYIKNNNERIQSEIDSKNIEREMRSQRHYPRL